MADASETSVSCGASWFVVLPDHERARALAGRLSARACRVLPHASGRPWLVGCWDETRMTVAGAGGVRLAVAGSCSLTAPELTARSRALRAAADAESVVAGVAGSFHLLASVDGEVYARGSLAGDRRLYRARIDGVTTVGDRARTLAWLTGRGPDPARLAACLVVPSLPYPLAHESVWRGVTTAPPGEALHLDADGSFRTARWWRPPSADLPLDDAAKGLRDALRAAVAARVSPGEVWGADLSGGMDSTSLCFLAAEAGARLVTVTLEWSAVGNEDAHYARRAAEHLPGVTRLTFPSAALPAHFADLGERRDPGDEPTVLLRDRAQQREVIRALVEHGARRRLSGYGGDHVVTPPPAYLHALLRRRPVTALRHAAAHRARGRWPLAATLRELLSRRPLAQWLAAQAGTLGPTGRGPEPECGWAPSMALPPWATGRARDLVSELLRHAADAGPEPSAADRGAHAWLHTARVAGTSAAHLAHWSAGAGLPVETPFCDDAVITAALRVRPDLAGHPARYKPLLAAAMSGIVPAPVLARTTKDHSGEEWLTGLSAQRRLLAAWADDSRLAALGLADTGALRRALLAPGLLNGGAAELEFSLGTEAWLRDLDDHPHPAHLKEHPSEPAESTSAAAP
ncbi:asparagine synthase-related protein [Streptomyces litchfieldiae]|uniref:Asparagine synthase-related protein n=1 Tax=Streptomyces litchfieldiae TaxID=3075543 RepID=A0ABU2MT31_9ACTN|nr:asparagine synthase-related protein [Streptomyces sp. DSM 44938]MDT0344234.1 asparagine synthase-related protein [Streptomyces sp. DSM 44938]